MPGLRRTSSCTDLADSASSSPVLLPSPSPAPSPSPSPSPSPLISATRGPNTLLEQVQRQADLQFFADGTDHFVLCKIAYDAKTDSSVAPTQSRPFSGRDTHFIFVMDTSASMTECANPTRNSPSRMDYTTTILGACLRVLQQQFEQRRQQNIYISVVAFASSASVIESKFSAKDLTDGKITWITDTVKNPDKIGCSTNFQAAINKIGTTVLRRPSRSQSALQDCEHIQEVVLFMTDGEVNEGLTEAQELASCIIRKAPHAIWKFIGVGSDFDWIRFSQIKHRFDTSPNHDTVPKDTTISFIDDLEHAHAIYGDIISPYVNSSLYDVRLKDNSVSATYPLGIVSFPDAQTGQLKGKDITFSMVPDGSTRFVIMSCSDPDHFNVAYDETTATLDGDKHIYTESFTRENISVVTSENDQNLLLLRIMKWRQKVLEQMGHAFLLAKQFYEAHENYVEGHYQYGVPPTPRRPYAMSIRHLQLVTGMVDGDTQDEIGGPNGQTSRANDQNKLQVDIENHISKLAETLNELKTLLDTYSKLSVVCKPTNESTEEVECCLVDTELPHLGIIRQLIQDISISKKALQSLRHRQSQARIAMMVVNSRADSQLHQRSYSVQDTSFLNDDQLSRQMTARVPRTPSRSPSPSQPPNAPNPYHQNTSGASAWASPPTIYSPYAPRSTRILSGNIESLSQHN